MKVRFLLRVLQVAAAVLALYLSGREIYACDERRKDEVAEHIRSVLSEEEARRALQEIEEYRNSGGAIDLCLRTGAYRCLPDGFLFLMDVSRRTNIPLCDSCSEGDFRMNPTYLRNHLRRAYP